MDAQLELVRQRLEKLGWNELRKEAKKAGIPAKGKKEELLEKVLLALTRTSSNLEIAVERFKSPAPATVDDDHDEEALAPAGNAAGQAPPIVKSFEEQQAEAADDDLTDYSDDPLLSATLPPVNESVVEALLGTESVTAMEVGSPPRNGNKRESAQQLSGAEVKEGVEEVDGGEEKENTLNTTYDVDEPSQEGYVTSDADSSQDVLSTLQTPPLICQLPPPDIQAAVFTPIGQSQTTEQAMAVHHEHLISADHSATSLLSDDGPPPNDLLPKAIEPAQPPPAPHPTPVVGAAMGRSPLKGRGIIAAKFAQQHSALFAGMPSILDHQQRKQKRHMELTQCTSERLAKLATPRQPLQSTGVKRARLENDVDEKSAEGKGYPFGQPDDPVKFAHTGPTPDIAKVQKEHAGSSTGYISRLPRRVPLSTGGRKKTYTPGGRAPPKSRLPVAAATLPLTPRLHALATPRGQRVHESLANKLREEARSSISPGRRTKH